MFWNLGNLLFVKWLLEYHDYMTLWISSNNDICHVYNVMHLNCKNSANNTQNYPNIK